MARQSPQEFVRLGGGRTLIIDEIQRMPEPTLSIKETVDQDRRLGRIIITGSSDLARVRGMKDSLAGRSILEAGGYPRIQNYPGKICRRWFEQYVEAYSDHFLIPSY